MGLLNLFTFYTIKITIISTEKSITMDGKYLINNKKYVLTKHAAKRAKSRDIKEEDVEY